VTDPNVSFARRSMVLSFSFAQKNHVVNFLCKRSVLFRPAEGNIPHQTQDYLIYGSSGRCAMFAHVVLCVVQTPTA